MVDEQKSAKTFDSYLSCKIDSNSVSNSKLKLDLCKCIETETTVSTARPQ